MKNNTVYLGLIFSVILSCSKESSNKIEATIDEKIIVLEETMDSAHTKPIITVVDTLEVATDSPKKIEKDSFDIKIEKEIEIKKIVKIDSLEVKNSLSIQENKIKESQKDSIVSTEKPKIEDQKKIFFSKTNDFLKKYIKNNLVDYKRIENSSSELKELLDLANQLNVPLSEVNNYQAFWINVYNLTVIKGVLDNYPIKSPLDVTGFFDKIKYTFNDNQYTLNDIENNLLRAKFPKEPRFHFVLVCGAMGCPPIINEVYSPSKLNAQLENQTKKALNDSSFIRIKEETNEVEFSQIFEWYKVDFVHNGTEIDYLNKYISNKVPSDYEVRYYNYDWNLNEL